MDDEDVIKLGGESVSNEHVTPDQISEKIDTSTDADETAETVITNDVRTAVSIADPESHLITQHSLIKAAFPHAIPICTDAFMNVSKNHYPLPWLVREITQNFVDENQENPGTLDGVDFKHTVESVDGHNSHLFDITGNWPFNTPTGLISLHSGKTSSVIKRNAGGNGIGLKQTVLRFLRDYGVESFEIEGEGWIVKYRMVTSGVATAALVANADDKFAGHEITDDWLIATVERSPNRGKCTYHIKTDDEEVAKALSDFPDLGVSSNNKYLENPDYENQFGAFKWVPMPDDMKEPPKPDIYSDDFEPLNSRLPKGRIFVNGQVMNYKRRGTSLDNYWEGPELVSIRLNNLDYDMSLDRPPIEPRQLREYLTDLLYGMTTEELLRELKKSEYIWATIEDTPSYSSDRMGAFVVIELLVDYLYYKTHYNSQKNAILAAFGPKYLYLERKISEKEKESLREEGYILCPEYFQRLGIPSATTKIDAMERAKKDRPIGTNLNWQAEHGGIEIGYPEIDIKKPNDFFNVFLKKFKKYIHAVEVISEEKRSIRFSMSLNFPPEVFYSQMITTPKTPEAKSLYELRGFIAYALTHNIFDEVVFSNGDLFTVFALSEDNNSLLSTVVKDEMPAGIHAEVNEKAWVNFLKIVSSESVKKALAKKKVEKNASTENADGSGRRSFIDSITDSLSESLAGSWSMPSFHFRYVYRILAATFGALGVAWTINNAEPLAQYANIMATSVSESLDDLFAEGPSEGQKFFDWFNDDNSYGQSPDGRKGRRSLSDILSFYDNSRVGSAFGGLKELGGAFGALKDLWTIEPPEKPEKSRSVTIDDFDIVKNPAPSQLKQLELLRDYIYLTTGVHVGNKLFIYTGDGAYGVNFGGSGIGLHESLLDVGFDEALSTFAHEVAHNEFSGHGPDFRRMDSILKMAIHDTVYGIAVKESNREPIDDDEALIIRIESMWDSLRADR